MNKLLTMAAAGCLIGAPPLCANDSGRTICVLRNRPAAINYVRAVRPSEEAQFSARINPYYGYVPGRLSTRYFPGLRVPAIYGTINPRLHYVSPILPNGYVGGLRNLPTNVVQIPPRFGTPHYGVPGFHNGGHNGGMGPRPTPHGAPGGGRPGGGGGGPGGGPGGGGGGGRGGK